MLHWLINRRTFVMAGITLLLVPTFFGASAEAADHSVTRITFDPPTPNVLNCGEKVNISFSYSTTEPGGVRIFARPCVGQSLAPDYAASGAGLSPTGSGTSTQYFTIKKGHVKVNNIRFEMYNAAQTDMVFKLYLPVHFEYGAP